MIKEDEGVWKKVELWWMSLDGYSCGDGWLIEVKIVVERLINTKKDGGVAVMIVHSTCLKDN